ncbi:MAG: FAD-dependent oxidoreductase [Jatrophihabitans sp.]|uniref:FAD-dependent oxidoreductase n=1 Tax=Jatrophihabitans sp. TaxID=1932789 RepID=UPI003F800008
MKRVVVVGNGMAGARFVQHLVERNGDCSITVIGEEYGPAYNRVLLSNVLAGVTRADTIDLLDDAWYAEHGVRLLDGIAVDAIDRAGRRVTLADGARVDYDVLVLATGSTPVVPAIAGMTSTDDRALDGVAAFRTRADCAALDRWASTSRRAVVVGAGVLGLEAARALAGRGVVVSVVQPGRRLMERQLDAAASTMLRRTVEALGVTVRDGVGVTGVRGVDRVDAVELSDGTTVAAELVVLCCGVRPRIGLARRAGLAVGRGVLVDDRLRSVTDRAVFAMGECAEVDGTVCGLVAPVWEQARVAAATVADSSAATSYRPPVEVTRLKAAGIELAAIGDSTCVEGADVITYADSRRGVYQKLVVRDGALAGALLLGDTRAAGDLVQRFERAAAVPDDAVALLLPRRAAAAPVATSPTVLPARATVCQCNGVTKADICAAWTDGARSTEEVARRTRATTGCGGCRETVEGVVEWLAGSDTDGVTALEQVPVLV